MSTQLVRLAAAVLTSEKGRRTVGWVLTAILSPVILLVAFLCCVGSGTAEHNGGILWNGTVRKCPGRIPGTAHADAGILLPSGFGGGRGQSESRGKQS